MTFKIFASTLTAVLAIAVSAMPAIAAENAAVMATVHQFVNGFNKGDTKTALAACAAPAFIIDDIPPHQWQGATACADWARDLDAADKRDGVTGGVVTLGKPWHVDVTGDRAYVVIPVTYTYKERGKPTSESGSVFTLVLKRVPVGWRITAWTWAKH